MIAVAEAEALAAARLSQELFEHSCRVAEMAAALAARWGADGDSARVAGLLHDLCRELSAEEALAAARIQSLNIGDLELRFPVQLLHGPLAAGELVEFGVSAEVLHAIAIHTVGRGGMTTLEKCLYVADASEPGRGHREAAEVRRHAEKSLDDAVCAAVTATLGFLIARGWPLAAATVDLYNECHADE